jgi:hypothetical protein
MKIMSETTDKDDTYLVISELYCGAELRGSDVSFGICERDGGFEVRQLPDGTWFNLSEALGEQDDTK